MRLPQVEKRHDMKSEIVIDFYNFFSFKISCIKTVAEKNNILSEMQEIFQEIVRNKPSCRNEMSQIYEKLKVRCEEAS